MRDWPTVASCLAAADANRRATTDVVPEPVPIPVPDDAA